MILIIIIKIEIKKVLIVFDDMIADIEYNKNFKRIIKELFYRARKKKRTNCIYYTILFQSIKRC